MIKVFGESIPCALSSANVGIGSCLDATILFRWMSSAVVT
jgi:hypothetical protein